jgi:hypothetical protein
LRDTEVRKGAWKIFHPPETYTDYAALALKAELWKTKWKNKATRRPSSI